LALAALVLTGGRAGRMQDDKRQVGLNNAAPQSSRRVALVIGNGAYQNIRTLKNPANDAADVAAALQELGFELVGGGAGVNLTQAQMRQRIREFGQKLRGGGVGVFYYAGHGVQLNGKNYLIPVEIDVASEADLEDAAVDIQYMLNQLRDSDNGLNIVILDACRNNPFEGRVRDARDGLAEVRAATGTLIAYATAPGSVASDGTGRNGAYTEALLKQLKQPGVEVLEMFRQVREAVYAASGRKQVPWTNDSLIGKFYFKEAAAAGPKPVASATPVPELATVTARDAKEAEREAWGLIYNSTDAQDFREFRAAYPNGAYFGQAGIRLEQLAWEGARNNGGKGALEGYLKEFPVGPNAATARLLLSRLERASQPVNPPAAPAARRPESTFRNRQGIDFVLLPSGDFMMGSNDYNNEKPVHKVTISQPFYMGKYEVTQAQWQAVMGSNPSKFNTCADCPVEQVSWNDAQEFIKKLNAQNDGYTYRLPSEAEWEYAARAGTTTAFAFGNSLDSTQANFDGNYPYGGAAKGVYRQKTTSVGEFAPNAWGLYDMHGNVWEWVEDIYKDSYANLPTDGSANVSRGDSSFRVLRGGSWSVFGLVCRSAFRYWVAPDFRLSSFGLRLVAVART
jgi:formylglycine-generating enzyme required for sulfatase activity